MPVILTKKSDTPSAVPTTANLTNAAGGAELAINTADKRLFSINSTSAIIEVGTNPSSLTCADASLTVLRSASGTITNLIATSGSITNLVSSDASATVLRSASGTITNLIATSASISDASATVLRSSSATITTLIGTSASITTASGTTLTYSSGTVTNLTSSSATLTNLTSTSGTITTLIGTTKVVTPFVDAASSAGGALRNASGTTQVQWGAAGNNFSVDVAANLNPANANISIAPTGSGTVTINPATAGTMNNVAIGGTTAAAGTFTTATLSGNLNFSSTAQRITGDMSNATEANRLFFQTSTTNGSTRLGVIPNGTQTASAVDVFNNSDPTNASFTRLRTSSTESQVQTAITGTGTYLPMTFLTGGSERMRLDTSGNLGIGTASPGSFNAAGLPLVVGSGVGNQGLTIYAGTASYSGIHFADGTAGDASYRGTVYYQHSTDSMQFWTSATERMRIDSSGNVGIGTASPGEKLTVSSASQTKISVIDTNGGAKMIMQAQLGLLGVIGSENSVPVAFYTNGSERMRLDTSGNVGIGTTSFGASSVKVIGIGNATTVPTGNPTGGGVLYVEAGALKYRGSSGTVTTIANA